MSVVTSKSVITHFTDNLFKRQKNEVIDQTVDPNIVAHVPYLASRIKGINAYRKFINDLHEAFPGATFKTEDLIAENDRVTIRWSIRGTCKNERFCPIATGGSTTLYLISIFRLANNRIVEYWQMDTGFSIMPDF